MDRPPPSIRPDALGTLRRYTPARISLGRAGGSLPTAAVLGFAVDHALARDAVHDSLDAQALAIALGGTALSSQAPDRRSYLLCPDLGRRLAPASLASIPAQANDCDIAIVVGDGLSATAAITQAPPLIARLVPLLLAAELSVGPITVVSLARVAIGDEIGSALRAKLVVMLIGERPGLGSADSLGAYLTYAPRIGRSDSERTCVSNIRPAGQPIDDAASTIAWLCREALRRRLTGTALKDERRCIATPAVHSLT